MIGTVLLATCVTIGTLACIWLKLFRQRQNSNITFDLPPGPWGFPLFGHLLFLGKHPGVTFMKWARIYGPIFYVKFGDNPTVVLNDAKIIKEAFQLKSFGGRPLLPNFIQSCNMKGIVLTDGPRQIEQRKFVTQAFKQAGLTKSDLEFRVREEFANFLKDLKSKCKLGLNGRSKKFTVQHFFQFPLLNSIWMSVMGRRFGENDPTLGHLTKLFEKAADSNSSVLAQMSWFFPWVSQALTFLRKNNVINGAHAIYSLMGHQIEESRKTYVAGQPNSVAHAYFDQVASTVDSNSSFYKGQEQSFTMGDIFFGAMDTTTVSLDWLLLYMAKEPVVQQKLQQELDNILGLEANGEARPPTVADRPNMPYTEAVIQELLRISSITPLGLFHRTLEEVIFYGYRIPKNAIIVSNLYGIHHDPEIWSEPDVFQPERFLNGLKAEAGNTLKPASITLPFSSGKRNCIGEGFARDQLFLMTAYFFQKFTVSLTEKMPSVEPVFGFVVKPHPFELFIKERNVTSIF